MDPLRTPLRRRLARATGQWPALVGLWALYGGAVAAVGMPALAASRVSPGQKLAIALFLAFFLAAEALALVLLNCALEAAVRARPRHPFLDATKALALVAGGGLLVLSLAKFRLTGAHLRPTDLWFLLDNLGQLGAEAQGTERGTAAVAAGGALAVGAALAWALDRLRRRPAAVPFGRLLVLALLLAAGAALTAAAYPTVASFASTILPEVRWASRRLAAIRLPPLPGAAAEAPPGSLGPPLAPYRARRPAAPANVVLVMLESIPWSFTSLGGGRPGTTPNLERLAAESVVFARPYTTSTHSDYAQMAILSSLHPRKYREHDRYTRLAYPRALLWDPLAAAGYVTALFSCQNERWGNMLGFLDTPGLHILRHSPDWRAARHRGHGAESKVYEETPVAGFRRWRQAAGPEPYFAYLNFQANHFPYEAPPEAPRPWAPHELDFPSSFLAYPPEKAPVLRNRFANALLYADRWLGEVVAALRAAGEWERTFLVVVSDHGEAFYEHEQPTHGTSLYEEQVRSFLLMRLPGEPARRVEQPVSLLDVAPTLLARLGLPPHGNFQGRSDILDPDYDGSARPFFFTIQGLTAIDGVLAGGFKYWIDWERQERRLFHLPSDPAEAVDRLAAEPAAAAALDRLLIDFLNRQTAYYGRELWRAGRYPPPLP